eukprot:4491878-Pleurochrysis_carterae.AAC.1
MARRDLGKSVPAPPHHVSWRNGSFVKERQEAASRVTTKSSLSACACMPARACACACANI